jgi:hypothetical protein
VSPCPEKSQFLKTPYFGRDGTGDQVRYWLLGKPRLQPWHSASLLQNRGFSPWGGVDEVHIAGMDVGVVRVILTDWIVRDVLLLGGHIGCVPYAVLMVSGMPDFASKQSTDSE